MRVEAIVEESLTVQLAGCCITICVAIAVLILVSLWSFIRHKLRLSGRHYLALAASIM